jgi:hypothetical protein
MLLAKFAQNGLALFTERRDDIFCTKKYEHIRTLMNEYRSISGAEIVK